MNLNQIDSELEARKEALAYRADQWLWAALSLGGLAAFAMKLRPANIAVAVVFCFAVAAIASAWKCLSFRWGAESVRSELIRRVCERDERPPVLILRSFDGAGLAQNTPGIDAAMFNCPGLTGVVTKIRSLGMPIGLQDEGFESRA